MFENENRLRVQEQVLLGAMSRSIRLGAAHALDRAGTFGRAFIRVAVWTNDQVDLRGGRLEGAEVGSVRIGISALPTLSRPIDSEIALDDAIASERSASHAAWFLMNDLYQSELGIPISTIMGYDGRYRLGELDDRGLWLNPVRTRVGEHAFVDLNDEVFAVLVQIRSRAMLSSLARLNAQSAISMTLCVKSTSSSAQSDTTYHEVDSEMLVERDAGGLVERGNHSCQDSRRSALHPGECVFPMCYKRSVFGTESVLLRKGLFRARLKETANGQPSTSLECCWWERRVT